MKDRTARALAIVALVFMGIFLAALIATMVDRTLLNNAVGYVALCSGVFVLMIFLALKADGRGFSVTKMNNEIEMQKIEKQLEAQEREEAEVREKSKSDEDSDGDTTECVADNISDAASAASEKPDKPAAENASDGE